MEIHDRIDGLRAAAVEARRHGTVGLVPTMGFLHQGHVSLIEAAAAECDAVVVTIFVNPLQFGEGEDLDAYPRDPEGDARIARASGATLLFTPSTEEMYPDAVLTSVHVDGLTDRFEGASRPTHFDGVATVVTKLFSIVGECRAYFGEKDFQQLAVVRRLVADLSLPVEVVGRPIVREPDGLALSSRNVYLDDDERSAAPVLHRALLAGGRAVVAGEDDAALVRTVMRDVVDDEPRVELDYVDVVDPRTLAPLDRCGTDARLVGAIRVGRTRLLDNLAPVEAAGPEPTGGP